MEEMDELINSLLNIIKTLRPFTSKQIYLWNTPQIHKTPTYFLKIRKIISYEKILCIKIMQKGN